MSTRAWSRSLLAWWLWLATLACCTAGLLVALVVTRPLTLAVLVEGAVFAVAFSLGYATVGLILALRRPANPIGWLYAASGLVWSLLIPLDPWVDQLIRSRRPLPLAAQLAAVAGEFYWAPAIALGITLPFLLLPNGRLRSRRWRVIAAAAVTGAVLIVMAGALMPGQTAETPLPIVNPFGLAGTAGRIATVLTYLGVVLNTISYPAALLCVVLRFRASRGVERQQLRWVVAGATVAVVGLLLGASSSGLTYLAVVAVPVSVAVAVLRYRLWDLDRLVSRTVTYALVTVVLVLPFLLILPAVTSLAAGSGSLAVAALTLAAAALFAPLRRRVQDLVDRRFNRRRYDAAQTIAAFGGRLRDEVDLDAIAAELVAVVERTVQPTQASLWLRPPMARGSGARPSAGQAASPVIPTPKPLQVVSGGLLGRRPRLVRICWSAAGPARRKAAAARRAGSVTEPGQSFA